MQVRQQNRRAFEPESIVICLLAVALAVAIGLPVYRTLMWRTDARVVLAQSKAVELAATTVAAKCRASGRAFADITSEHGLAEGIAEQISELSACEGEVYLLQWDAVGYVPAKLLYVEGEFAASYSKENGEAGWSVYRIKPEYSIE